MTKAGTPVPKNAVVRINAEQPKYVCRAGHKLEAALDQFGIDVAGLTALDAGLSTGGFTDCLLQRGIGNVSRQVGWTTGWVWWMVVNAVPCGLHACIAIGCFKLAGQL